MLSESKIRIMKAIHNHRATMLRLASVVLSESKIRIMKAIHNKNGKLYVQSIVVLSESKIDKNQRF